MNVKCLRIPPYIKSDRPIRFRLNFLLFFRIRSFLNTDIRIFRIQGTDKNGESVFQESQYGGYGLCIFKIRKPHLSVFGNIYGLIRNKKVTYSSPFRAVKTAEEIEGEIANEYKNKLCVDGKTLPDPFVLKTGWKNEEEGICFWPMVTNFYIIKYQASA